MFYLSGFPLFDHVFGILVFRIQILFDVQLADVMHQIKIEIIDLQLFQLLFKYFRGMSHVFQIIARKFCRDIIAAPVIFLQELPHDGFRISVMISPGGIEVIDAV